jgi:hypothetical protein
MRNTPKARSEQDSCAKYHEYKENKIIGESGGLIRLKMR